MASRAEEATLRATYRARTRSASGLHTRSQRFLFVVALITFGIASLYTSLALLRRVTPALFPGKDLPFSVALELLPGPVKISAPGDSSVFNKRINLLIIGVDKRPDYRDLDAYNTDTLMVATIDPLSKQTSILSFPRDMLISIHPPGGGSYEDRINASYAVGILNDRSFEAGAKQLETDLKFNFGIDIDYWVLLDFKGVEALINSLDGVDVDVPDELSFFDWRYSDDDIHVTYISVPAGPQHLDGYHAVAFGRYRNDSDLFRVKRQQLVLTTALQKVFSRGLLNNPLDLWDAYSQTVKTDVPRGRMPGYGLLLKDTQGRIKTFSLGDPVNGVPTLIGHTTEFGASVLLWNSENVQFWLSQVFTKAVYSQSTVEIDNGQGNDDGFVRASALGRYLAYSKGLPTVKVGPEATVQPDTTITLYSDAKRALAEDIARWLGLPATAIRTLPRTDVNLPDVIIVIGENFKLPGS